MVNNVQSGGNEGVSPGAGLARSNSNDSVSSVESLQGSVGSIASSLLADAGASGGAVLASRHVNWADSSVNGKPLAAVDHIETAVMCNALTGGPKGRLFQTGAEFRKAKAEFNREKVAEQSQARFDSSAIRTSTSAPRMPARSADAPPLRPSRTTD